MSEVMEDRIFVGGPLHGQTRPVAATETRLGQNVMVEDPLSPTTQVTDPVPTSFKQHVYWVRIYHGQTKAYKFMVHEDLNDDDVMDLLIKSFLLLEGKPCADAKPN